MGDQGVALISLQSSLQLAGELSFHNKRCEMAYFSHGLGVTFSANEATFNLEEPMYVLPFRLPTWARKPLLLAVVLVLLAVAAALVLADARMGGGTGLAAHAAHVHHIAKVLASGDMYHHT